VGRGLVRPRVRRSRRYHSEGGCRPYSQRAGGVPSGRGEGVDRRRGRRLKGRWGVVRTGRCHIPRQGPVVRRGCRGREHCQSQVPPLQAEGSARSGQKAIEREMVVVRGQGGMTRSCLTGMNDCQDDCSKESLKVIGPVDGLGMDGGMEKREEHDVPPHSLAQTTLQASTIRSSSLHHHTPRRSDILVLLQVQPQHVSFPHPNPT
jgi:hypothetical protein